MVSLRQLVARLASSLSPSLAVLLLAFATALPTPAMAVDPTRLEMLVANTRGDVPSVVRYDAVTGAYLGLYRIDPSTSDGLFAPRGLGRNPARGTLLVTADCGGCDDAVLEIDVVTGAAKRLVPLGPQSPRIPATLQVGPGGRLYVADDTPAQVRIYATGSGALIDSVDLPARPLALAFRSDGQLLVLTDANEIRLVDPVAASDLGVVVPMGAGDLQASLGADITVGPDDLLYVSNSDTDQILRFNAFSGSFLEAFVAAGAGGLDAPAGLAFNPIDGDLYVVSSTQGQVYRYDGRSGAFESVVVPSGPAGGNLTGPSTLAFASIPQPPLAQRLPPAGSVVDLPTILQWNPLVETGFTGHRVRFFDADPAAGGNEIREPLCVGTETHAALLAGSFPDDTRVFWRVEAIRGPCTNPQVLGRSPTALPFLVKLDISGDGTLTLIRGLVLSNVTAAALVGAEVSVSTVNHQPGIGTPQQYVLTTSDGSGYAVLALNTEPYPIRLQAQRAGYTPGMLEIAEAEARVADNTGGTSALPVLNNKSILLTAIDQRDGIGLYAPQTRRFLLRATATPGQASAIAGIVPSPPAIPLVGDWDGDGIDSPGLYHRPSGRFLITNSLAPGPAQRNFRYGPVNVGWLPLVGDWNGDGYDTPGLYNPALRRFYLRDTLLGGRADAEFVFGPGGVVPIVGDWNGDGRDTIGVYDRGRGSFFLRNSNSGGGANVVVRFGPTGRDWVPLAGDWNGDSVDTVGLYNPGPAVFHLLNAHAPGTAPVVLRYGPQNAGWQPIIGRLAPSP